MTQKATERLLWAVEMLAVEPDDHLLEIGCGHGVAVLLVCEKLTSGKITAIDRSQTMIDIAAKRNQSYIAEGKAAFQCATLDDADLEDDRFDKIFAIRLGLFLEQPTRELEIIKSLLATDGALYIFYDPPLASKSQGIAKKLTSILQENGFHIHEVLLKELQSVSIVCVMAKPQ